MSYKITRILIILIGAKQDLPRISIFAQVGKAYIYDIWAANPRIISAEFLREKIRESTL